MPDDAPNHPSNEGEGKNSEKALVSITATDLFGFGKGLDSLMKALRAGVGQAFDPIMRAVIRRGDHKTARGWLEIIDEAGLKPESVDIQTIDGRADIRVRAERQKRQRAREAITIHAIGAARAILATGHVAAEDPTLEDEWIDRFWRLAQDVTRDDLRSLWGRLLARRSIGVGEISPRTLEALSLLDGWEIDELTRIARLVCRVTRGGKRTTEVLLTFNTRRDTEPEVPGSRALTHRNFDIDRIVISHSPISRVNALLGSILRDFDANHFSTIGLIQEPVPETFNFWLSEEEGSSFEFGGKVFRIEGGRAFRIEMNTYLGTHKIADAAVFSRIGREIIDLIEVTPDYEYFGQITTGLAHHGVTLVQPG
jgi:hypothetical protein